MPWHLSYYGSLKSPFSCGFSAPNLFTLVLVILLKCMRMVQHNEGNENVYTRRKEWRKSISIFGGKIPHQFNMPQRKRHPKHLTHPYKHTIPYARSAIKCICFLYERYSLYTVLATKKCSKNQFIDFEMPEFNNNFSCIFIVSRNNNSENGEPIDAVCVERRRKTDRRKAKEKRDVKSIAYKLRIKIAQSSYSFNLMIKVHVVIEFQRVFFYGDGKSVFIGINKMVIFIVMPLRVHFARILMVEFVLWIVVGKKELKSAWCGCASASVSYHKTIFAVRELINSPIHTESQFAESMPAQ